MICEIGLSYCRKTKVITPIYGEVNATQQKLLEFKKFQNEALISLLYEFIQNQITKGVSYVNR